MEFTRVGQVAPQIFWMNAVSILVLLFGVFRLASQDSNENFRMQTLQLQADWNAPLVIDIMVGAECRENYDLLYQREWPGMQQSCDCITQADIDEQATLADRNPGFGDIVFKDKVDFYGSLIKNQKCTEQQLATGCVDRPEVEPVFESSVLGNKICAKRSEMTWGVIPRPTDTDRDICEMDPVFCLNSAVRSGDKCPPGYTLCSSVNIQHRVCAKQGQCPITDLKFILKSSKLPSGY